MNRNTTMSGTGPGAASKNRRYTDRNPERRKKDINKPADPEQKALYSELDEALTDTFPASDPVQLTPKSQH